MQFLAAFSVVCHNFVGETGEIFVLALLFQGEIFNRLVNFLDTLRRAALEAFQPRLYARNLFREICDLCERLQVIFDAAAAVSGFGEPLAVCVQNQNCREAFDFKLLEQLRILLFRLLGKQALVVRRVDEDEHEALFRSLQKFRL